MFGRQNCFAQYLLFSLSIISISIKYLMLSSKNFTNRFCQYMSACFDSLNNYFFKIINQQHTSIMRIKLISTILALVLLSTISYCQSDDSDILGDHQHQQQVVQKKQAVESKVNQTTTPEQIKTVRRQFKFDLHTLNYYRYEMAAVVCILVYLVAYRRGKSQNYNLMEGFYKKIRTFVDNNFSHIGFTKTNGQEPFVGQSPNEALFYASGRENVDFLQIKFNMLKRQDLLYHLVYETIYPEKDMIIIDIATTTNQPVVFCIASKKKLKHITDTNIDLAKLAGSFDVKGLNSYYHALSQSSQILDQIIDSNTCKKLNDFSSLIHSIHYSDQKIFSESQGNLRAIFYASEKNAEKYQAAFELLFSIVDKMKSLKLSANQKARAFKAREAFNASKEKEKLQKHKQDLRKKKEQKRKQEEAWLRSLPADKQKRQDEKRKKKQLNKFMKSRVMKVG